MGNLDSNYWTNRYEEGHIGWDIGSASPALISFCETVPKDSEILIPGAGNAYEWGVMKANGYDKVTILDISPHPINDLQNKHTRDKDHFILGDFFEHQGKYDVILEQTFFCALAPTQRPEYIQKMHELLGKNGLLAGVLFSKIFEHQGPPFGGEEEEYRKLFSDKFQLLKMEPCYNSIAPRMGSELFFIARPL